MVQRNEGAVKVEAVVEDVDCGSDLFKSSYLCNIRLIYSNAYLCNQDA